MSIKRIALLTATVVTIGLTAGAVVAQKIGNSAPAFTAIEVENHYAENGKLVYPSYSTHVSWADGSNEDVRQAVSGRPAGVKVITDLDRGLKIVVDQQTSSKATYRLSPSEIEQAKAKKSCAALPSAGELLGFAVVTQSRTTEMGDRRSTTTAKLAPALNCFALESDSVLKDAGEQVLASTRKTVTQVIRAAPERSELLAGLTFSERKPSEVMAAHNRASGKECPACEARSGLELDRVYAGRRPE